jgi:uncharacterized protein YggU (UPF0235/DUF167 family)
MRFRRSKPSERDRRSTRSFREDDRAIEGLPIRLVIALVVGVMALGIMTNILSGLGSIGETEVKPNYDGDRIVKTNGDSSLTIKAVDENGKAVNGATIIIRGGTAQLEQSITLQTGPDSNTVSFDLASELPSGTSMSDLLRSDQSKGTLKVEIIPPSDSDWTDDETNNEVVVIKGS